MYVVIVSWLDVTKATNDDSFNEKTDIDSRLTTMKTVGWLYNQSDKVMLIVQEFDGDKPRDYVTIPKSLIIKIIEVEKL